MKEIWERVQGIARTFNGFFDRLSTFLMTVSTPSADWPANFLQQWEHLCFVETEPNETEEG